MKGYSVGGQNLARQILKDYGLAKRRIDNESLIGCCFTELALGRYERLLKGMISPSQAT